MSKFIWLFLAFTITGCGHNGIKTTDTNTSSPLIDNTRPFTLVGARTGEAYFNKDGTKVIFQSERHSTNPFYQIYYTDLNSFKTSMLSPGHGKTTCAWIHPNDQKALFSSTHLDKNSLKLQKQEIAERKSGQTKKYSWDYDENYEIFETPLEGKRKFKQLTTAKGYDAEASYSPDGKWIAFASNRHAYTQKLNEKDQRQLDANPSYFLDIYIMKSDGTQVTQLTTESGYDGGPFFSPDGKRITWRKFSADGHMAEIFTMNIDGSDKKQLTNHKAMSWAPFYHPSGDYIIYTTNIHGYSNFELYLVRADGQNPSVRVTHEDGFDGLPVFLPSGNQLTWTRKRSNGSSQVFIAEWNNALARKMLDLPHAETNHEFHPDIRVADLKHHIQYLASKTLKGRATGSKEEVIYTAKLADFFQTKGLSSVKGKYLDSFEYTEGVNLGKNNSLNSHSEVMALNSEWMPLSLSKSGKFNISELHFVGYGIVAPATEKHSEYNSYKDVAVKGKWVVAFDGLPEDTDNESRQHLFKYSNINHKVMMARHNGAIGVILLKPPLRKQQTGLLEIKSGVNKGESSLPVISMTLEAFNKATQNKRFDLVEINKTLDRGKLIPTNSFTKLNINLNIDLNPIYKKGFNTLAQVVVPGAKGTIVIGAHGDHLGHGHSDSSLANNKDTDKIHYGADDNASGVAAVLELAHLFQNKQTQGTLNSKYNLLFAVWSGEELGNLGSSAFIKNWKGSPIVSYINMDMIGRYNNGLSIQGIGSSNNWNSLLESTLFKTELSVQLLQDPYLPTDSMSFYVQGIPTINFFTGAHEDYHTPKDTEEKINYTGLKKITHLVFDISSRLASLAPLKYEKVEKTSNTTRSSSGFRIFLGTIPDYNQEAVKGVKISGVVKGGPAEDAGLKGGDIIVHLDTYKIESIYDYVYSLQAIRPDKPTNITVLRESRPLELNITPKLRE